MSPPPTNQGRRFRPEPLTAEEVGALLRAVPTRSASGVRTRALIAVMFGAGLRVSETLALKPRDVDTRAGTVYVRHGKGDKPRRVGLDATSCELLGRWLDRRPALGLTGRHPVFAAYVAGAVGRPLDPRYVRATLARFGAAAGIDKRVHPHGLRHSCAFGMAQDAVPTHAIQAQLGHASLAVTDRYVRHLHPGDLIDTMRARDPYKA